MNDLIVIKQLPVIEEQLRTVSAEIDEKIALADSLICSEDTVKQVKAMRAELNKDSAALEEQRKAVKAAVMQPYNEFEAAYKRYVLDKYRAADVSLKAKVDGVEGELKRRKWDELREWFEEYRLSRGVDFANMDTWNPNVTLTATLKGLKKEGKAYIDRICNDLTLIEAQEHSAEIMVEYRSCFDLTASVMAVKARHARLKDEQERRAELEARRAAEAKAVKRVEAAMPPPLAPPVVKPLGEDQVRTLAFKVTAPLSKLRELKKFLEDGGYEYE